MISHEGASGSCVIALADGASAPVSALSQGRFRYNNGLSRLEYSENGGPWTPLTGGGSAGGWTDDGLVVRLTTSTDTVSVGNNLMAGTEKFRVTAGSVLFDGAVGAVPVSGAGTRFMWSPASYSLRAGQVTGTQWDAANVGLGSVAFGKDTRAPGDTSLAVGDTTQSEAKWSVALGSQSRARRIGQVSMANGMYAVQGDIQQSHITMWRLKPAATVSVDLTLDGNAPAGAALPTSNRFILEDNRTYTFEALVQVRNTAASESKSWVLTCSMKRDVGAGTVAFVGVQTKTVVGQNAPAATWDVNFFPDAVNGAMRIQFDGVAAKVILAGAGIRWFEVGV